MTSAWLPTLPRALRRWIDPLVNLVDCGLQLLEDLLCQRMVVLVRMQLNGYRSEELLDLVGLFALEPYDQGVQRCLIELVDQEGLLEREGCISYPIKLRLLG